jgi:hypothetical protein
MPTKDRQPLIQTYVVYKIPYLCGKRDMSQTCHPIPTRISKYIRNTELENQQSAVAEHSADFNSGEVVANIWTYHPYIINL